jgi:hypothetical protein
VARRAETSCTSKIHKVDENEASVKNFSKRTTLTSYAVPPNVDEEVHYLAAPQKITSKPATVKGIPLTKKMSHWLKKRSLKKDKLSLDRQIDALKKDGDVICATEKKPSLEKDKLTLDRQIDALKVGGDVICAIEEKPSPLERQIDALRKERELMCALQRADADITTLKESVELFNRNCSILCPGPL